MSKTLVLALAIAGFTALNVVAGASLSALHTRPCEAGDGVHVELLTDDAMTVHHCENGNLMTLRASPSIDLEIVTHNATLRRHFHQQFDMMEVNLRMLNGDRHHVITHIYPNGTVHSPLQNRFATLDDVADGAHLALALGPFGVHLAKFSFDFDAKLPAPEYFQGHLLHLTAERYATIRGKAARAIAENATAVTVLRENLKGYLAWALIHAILVSDVLQYSFCGGVYSGLALSPGYGGSYEQCENECFGMCGPGCCCWKRICGDCSCYSGCEVHDCWCSCHSMIHYRCVGQAFNPNSFKRVRDALASVEKRLPLLPGFTCGQCGGPGSVNSGTCSQGSN